MHGLQLLSQHMPPKPPLSILELVLAVLPSRHTEHLIQLLERQSLSLRNKQENPNPAYDTPGSIPSESALRFECGLQTWPAEGEDEVEAPGRCGGEGHADFTDVEGEGFGAVGEWHGSHARRIKNFEQIHARRDHGDFRGRVFDPEGETGPEKEDG